MTELCEDETRLCPITPEYLDKQATMHAQVEVMSKVIESFRLNGTIKWISVVVAVATLAFGAGSLLTSSTKADTATKFTAIETLIKETNTKLDTKLAEQERNLQYNGNRITRLEERTKP